MKVLLVNSYTGGHNVLYTKKIAEYLVKSNVEVSFITSNQFNCEIQDVKIIKIYDKSNKYRNSILKKVCKRIYYKKILELDLKHKYDIVHLLYADAETIPMFLSLRYLKKIKKISKIEVGTHWSSNVVGAEGIKSKLKTDIFNFLKIYLTYITFMVKTRK